MTEPRVGCPYCTRDIAVADFAPWTGRSRLLSAACECGRTVTMTEVALTRRTRSDVPVPGGAGGAPIEVEDYELASARLEWARETACLHLPVQREAFNWHLACCEAAFAALSRAEATR
jgi:hypothetical protein